MATGTPARKSGFGGLFLLGVFAAMLIAAAWLSLTLRSNGVRVGNVTIDGRVRVRTEVAATPAAREQGLSGHAPLAAGQGMLFIFEQPGTYGFWMKDMLFPLDFLWIRGGVLVDLTTDVPGPVAGEQLPVYYPHQAVDEVLEVPAGFAKANGLRLGVPVTYQP